MKPKKLLKKLRKSESLSEFFEEIGEFSEEIWEEAEDFFKDLIEDIFRKKKPEKIKREMKIYGMRVMARPAYLFAERIENLLKLIFGISIVVSALIAGVWGFTRTSDLLAYFINSIPGRFFLIVIGISYLIIGLWKMFNLHK